MVLVLAVPVAPGMVAAAQAPRRQKFEEGMAGSEAGAAPGPSDGKAAGRVAQRQPRGHVDGSAPAAPAQPPHPVAASQPARTPRYCGTAADADAFQPSPNDVALLSAAAAADSALSSDPPTPLTDASSSRAASSASASPPPAAPAQHAGASPAAAPAAEEPAPGGGPEGTAAAPPRASPTASEAGELAALAAEAAAALAACTAQRRSSAVDVATLVERLGQRPITSQVVAWGWDAAAVMAAQRRTMPAQVFSALWPATHAVALRLAMPQDVLEMLESWLTLLQQCPRHFGLSQGVLRDLTTYALPAAVKRMSEKQLAALAALARDIALHRCDALVHGVSAPGSARASARDLMQPALALAAAEAAWRCANPARYVSPETVSAILTAAPAWSWRVVRHRDAASLASLKLATAAALEELVPHSPRDLASSGALCKLRGMSRTSSLSSGRAGA